MKQKPFLRRLAYFLIVLGGCLLVACSKLTAENFAKVQNGMTEDEVLRILGSPTTMDAGSLLGVTGSVYRYESKDGTKKVSVIFVNGKVFGKEGSL
jgi:hypothetical protein